MEQPGFYWKVEGFLALLSDLFSIVFVASAGITDIFPIFTDIFHSRQKIQELFLMCFLNEALGCQLWGLMLVKMGGGWRFKGICLHYAMFHMGLKLWIYQI